MKNTTRPNHSAWFRAYNRHQSLNVCVCCGRKTGADALVVLVSSANTDGTGFDLMDPANPGNDFCDYVVGSDCAKRLPAGFALTSEAMNKSLRAA